jgi:hypothetical protein
MTEAESGPAPSSPVGDLPETDGDIVPLSAAVRIE